jgi:hypothetical protein
MCTVGILNYGKNILSFLREKFGVQGNIKVKFPRIEYYIIEATLTNPSSMFYNYIVREMIKEDARKATWYEHMGNLLGRILHCVGGCTQINKDIQGIIGGYMEPVHPTDLCDHLLLLCRTNTMWVIKGFLTEHTYNTAVRAANNERHKRKNLYFRWGEYYRMKRYIEADNVHYKLTSI